MIPLGEGASQCLDGILKGLSLLTSRSSTALLGVFVCGVLTALPPLPAQAAPPVELNQVTTTVTEYLTARTDALVGADADETALVPTGLALTAELDAGLRDDLSVLVDRREDLRQLHEAYTDAHTTVSDIDVLSVDDQSLVLSLQEHTVLDYERILGDEPASTEYVLPHTLTFEREGSGWSLAQDEVAQDALLPITYVQTPEPGPDDPVAQQFDAGYLGQVATGTAPTSSVDCGVFKACDATDGVNAATKFPPSQVVPLDLPAEPKVEQPVATTKAELAGAVPAGLNYPAMVNYALQYWSSYNTSYRTFSNDCTNFISQVLRRGGWDFDYGWYRSSNNWWYNSWNQTWTWAGAENWSRFAPRRTTFLDNTYRLLPSDMMQMDFDRNGNMNHSMVVTSKSSSGMPYFTYHTTNTKNRSMASIYSSYPNAWYYAYRT